MASGKKPRIVALPIPAEGHASPMMHLSNYLAKQGFSIIFVTMPTNNKEINFDNMKQKGTWPPPDADITVKEIICEGVPLPPRYIGDKVNVQGIMRHWMVYYKDLFEEMVLANDASFVISDHQFGWAMDVANKLNIPGAILFTGSAAWSWIELKMPEIRSVVPMQEPGVDELVDDYVLLENPCLRRSDIPWHFWNTADWQELSSCNSSAFQKCDMVLVNSCGELEEDAVTTMVQLLGEKYIPVGPLFLYNDLADTVGLVHKDETCISWLDQQPTSSVLYISFGSIAVIPKEGEELLIQGLEQSGQRYLWAIRSEPSPAIQDFYKRTNEQGLIVSWSPQLKVLSHGSVGAFLSHCGWNSTLESVANGQPMLCWPQLYEQNLNTKLIVENLKVGMRIMMGGNNVQGVTNAIQDIIQGEQGREMKARVQRLQAKIREAVTKQDAKLLQTINKQVNIKREDLRHL